MTLWTAARQALLSMGLSRQEHGVGFHALLQEIFPTQGSKLGLLHWQAILYHLSHQGSPELLQSSSEIISYFGSSLIAQWLLTLNYPL